MSRVSLPLSHGGRLDVTLTADTSALEEGLARALRAVGDAAVAMMRREDLMAHFSMLDVGDQ